MGTEERNIRQLYEDFCELIEGMDEGESIAPSVPELKQIREIVENNLLELEHRNGFVSERERFFETLFTSTLYAFSAGYMTAYKESAAQSTKDRPCEACEHYKNAGGVSGCSLWECNKDTANN